MRRAGALALVLALSGCGDGGTETGDEVGLPSAGGGGVLTYALPELPATIDPLSATSRGAQLISRQVHEPLVVTASPPYEEAPRGSGLAAAVKPSPDRTVWKVTLRSGIRFQDGSPFNAGAVLANSRRWSSRPAGRTLLPSLFAVDAPRPKEVRFQFHRPLADLSARLSSPRLGIVSPEALNPPTGERARFLRGAEGTGTGAFELGASSGSRLELSRYAGWWGSAAGLGPAMDALVFIAAPGSDQRLELLRSGEAQVAEPLEAAQLAPVAADPLLSSARIGGIPVGMEASVRGLGSGAGIPALSGVWLTRIGG